MVMLKLATTDCSCADTLGFAEREESAGLV